MKLLPVGAVLVAAYIAFQGFNLISIWGMMSAKSECEEAVVTALRASDPTDLTRTSKKVDAGCARLQAHADVAERVLRKMP
jgi:hypothetical protein